MLLRRERRDKRRERRPPTVAGAEAEAFGTATELELIFIFCAKIFFKADEGGGGRWIRGRRGLEM